MVHSKYQCREGLLTRQLSTEGGVYRDHGGLDEKRVLESKTTNGVINK